MTAHCSLLSFFRVYPCFSVVFSFLSAVIRVYPRLHSRATRRVAPTPRALFTPDCCVLSPIPGFVMAAWPGALRWARVDGAGWYT